MNSFMDRIGEKKDYLLKNGDLKHVSYGMFRLWRTLKPVMVRLPITTIAKMKYLEGHCPGVWESRQEMLFEMIESCIQDWIAKQPSPKKAAAELDHVARRALQKGMGTLSPDDAAGEI
jgi:hypothetical protein